MSLDQPDLRRLYFNSRLYYYCFKAGASVPEMA
jgi:hypothetical protein